MRLLPATSQGRFSTLPAIVLAASNRLAALYTQNNTKTITGRKNNAYLDNDISELIHRILRHHCCRHSTPLCDYFAGFYYLLGNTGYAARRTLLLVEDSLSETTQYGVFEKCESALFHAAVTRALNAVSRRLLISAALTRAYQEGSPTYNFLPLPQPSSNPPLLTIKETTMWRARGSLIIQLITLDVRVLKKVNLVLSLLRLEIVVVGTESVKCKGVVRVYVSFAFP